MIGTTDTRNAASAKAPVLCIWLTGLQGAGKSTLAVLLKEGLESRGREVALIDGDDFRRSHSPDLGFSRRDREINVARMAAVAREHACSRRDVVVAAMSPFRESRARAREVIEPHAAFLEVHVDTPLSVCRKRDTKGLYAAASRGEVSDLSGVDAPFEPPEQPAVRVSMASLDPSAAAVSVLARVLE